MSERTIFRGSEHADDIVEVKGFDSGHLLVTVGQTRVDDGTFHVASAWVEADLLVQALVEAGLVVAK